MIEVRRPCSHCAYHNGLRSFLNGEQKVGGFRMITSPSQVPLMRAAAQAGTDACWHGGFPATQPTCLGSQGARKGEVGWELVDQ